MGAFIRVFNRGRWYFLSTTKVDQLDTELADLIATSYKLPPGDEVFKSPKGSPPFERLIPQGKGFYGISLAHKMQLTKSYLSVFSTVANLKTHRIEYSDTLKKKAYMSSSESFFEYDVSHGGIVLRVVLAEECLVESGDSSGVTIGVTSGVGGSASGNQVSPSEFASGRQEDRFEDGHYIYASEFVDLANRQAEFIESFKEAQKFIHAPTIIPGKMGVVMSSQVTGVFTHESFGHKSEADLLLVDPDSIKEWEIGKKVGAETLSIVDCGAHEYTSGYCPIDDEGTLAQKSYLIKNGYLVGRLHSQQTAQVFNELPTGNMRSINFEYEPIVRMTSTYIEPGHLTFDELLKKCDTGVYIYNYRHGSGGSTFTIAPHRAYRIENGKLGQPVRVSVISGSLFKTLENIEGISNNIVLHSSAFGGCGKGEQAPLSVAMGGPAIYVSQMQVS